MRRFSPLVLLLTLVTSVWAQTGNQIVEFAGTTFRPQVYQLQGRDFYRADDPEVVSMLSRADVNAQWSSSGRTLFVFAPGRESYWTAGSAETKINGKEQKAPGMLLIEDGKPYMEPQALFYAMTVKGVKADSGYALFPVITELAKSDTGFLLRSASKAKPKSQVEDDTTVLTIEGFAWDGPKETAIDETTFRFEGGAEVGSPLQIRVSTKPFYLAKLGGSTLLNETKVDIVPNFPGAANSGPVALKALTSNKSEGKPMLVFEFDSGTQLHYIKDTSERVLHVFIPRGTYEGERLKETEWPGVEIASVSTASYPVLEVTIPMGSGNLEFVEIEDAPTTLALLRGSEKDLADSGSMETPGWANIQGTIVIDPGHGGSDPGCRNHDLGTRECDVTLKIALNLAEVLRAQGWTVILTRETDRDVTYAGSPDMMELEARSNVANNINADLFMSIHCNASVGAGANGTSIHWWKAEDYEFAQSLEYVLGTTVGLGQKGLIRDRFAVLRCAKMPSVLVETAFLTNPSEGAKLSDPEFQKVIARQLAGGLAAYMQGRYASRGAGRTPE